MTKHDAGGSGSGGNGGGNNAPSSSSSSTPRRPLPLDARAAFDVCRSAGFSSAARAIAKAAGEHEWFVDVLLDDATAAAAAPTEKRGDENSTSPAPSPSAALAAAADEALAYCASLSRRDAASVARRHGRALLRARPEAATALLMRLCTPSPETGEPAAMALADAAPLYGGGGDGVGDGKGGESEGGEGGSSRAALALLCEFVLNSSPQPPRDPSLYHTLLQLYLSEGALEREARGAGTGAARRPVPRRRDDALALLERGWPRAEADDPRFDPDTVLLLCRRPLSAPSPPAAASPSSSSSPSPPAAGTEGWHEGQIFVHERRGDFREAMGVLAAAGDHRGVVETALRHGGGGGGGGRGGGGGTAGASSAAAASSSSSSSSRSSDPGLIPLALEYVAGLDDDAARPCAVELLSALMEGAGGGGGGGGAAAAAATGGGGGNDGASAPPSPSSSSSQFLVPPIVAIDVLSRNPRITLGDVKPFVAAALAADGARAAADAAEAARLRASAASARADAARLATDPCVFQATRCAASGAPLELPTVHFLCGHSFNARALRQGAATGAAGSGSAAAFGATAVGAVPAAAQKNQRGASSSCTECPLCGPGLRTLAAASASASAVAAAAEGGGARRLQQQGTSDAISSASAAADKFFSALRAAPDGFDAVADWVGRGLFAATRG